jgi:LPS export ABC transporter protein LptC
MGVRIALLVALLAAVGCSDAETPSTLQDDSSGVEREMRGFSLTETLEGALVWKLDADYAYRLPDKTRDKVVYLKGVTLLFYDDDGSVNSTLTSEKGTVDEQSGVMTAQNRVRVVSAAGDTLTTEELTYSKDADRITGPGFVRLAKPDRILTGFEFEADPDLSDYEIHRDVTITIVNGPDESPAAP